MKHSYVIILALLYCVANTTNLVYGQEEYPNHYKRCGTMLADSLLRAQNPQMGTLNDFEKWLQPLIEKYKSQEKNMSTGKTYEVIRIPTIVHVIHNGEPIGTGSNISNAQIQSQITVLNEDFRRLIGTPGYNTHPAGADVQIEFCLVTRDNMGNPMTTPGIRRINRSSMGFTAPPYTMPYIESTIKPATVWNTSEFFNIWVMALSGGLLGYAQFPEIDLGGLSTAPQSAATDGVVIGYNFFGSSDKGTGFTLSAPYDKGRTATHEVGHWLGLRHIWGDGGCGLDDFCADTPESSAPNYGCPTVTTCGSVDMVQNYMDYSNDACMNIFTRDQRTRMRTVMYNSPRRMSLLNSDKCDPIITGLPQIYFAQPSSITEESSIGGTTDCRGYRDITIPLRISSAPTGAATVTFNLAGTASNFADYQLLTPSVVFPNGGISNQNLIIRIFDDGAIETAETIILTYTITGATNAVAGTFNQTHTVTIDDNDYEPNFGINVIFSENFEASGGSLPTGWASGSEITPAGVNQWVVGTNGGLSGTYSLYITNNTTTRPLSYNNTSISNARVRTPLINAVGRYNLTLSFQWRCVGEYYPTYQEYFDYGHLLYSLDGINFSIMPTPNDMITTQFANQNTPTAFTMQLPHFLNNTSFYLAWRWINDNAIGSNPPFAIDNILVTSTTTVIEDALNATDDQYLGPNSKVYFYDNTTNKLMICIENNTTHDYGCTNVLIDRAGTSAVAYYNTPVSTWLTSKSYLITPTNNNPSGTYDITLYYTSAEVTGWETTTGNTWTDCNIAKTGGPISNITPSDPYANGPTNYLGTGNVTGSVTGGRWVKATFNSGFSGFAAGIPDGPPLPIQKLELIGYASSLGNQLEWVVYLNKNVKEFILERSTNRVHFERIYGVESGQKQYIYTDNELKEDRYFYRIKRVYKDGNYEYSNIVEIYHQIDEKISIYPNPSQETLWICYKTKEQKEVTLCFYSMTGQVVKNLSKTLFPGIQEWSINISDLPAGVYMLHTRHHTPIKVIKQ
ncbi:MAG: M43 family zinc metalloprotease [Bacteroidia bacterium]|nr:M43 family zinc metalloprotease [Bacteroidia bacterium]MDW8346315.1 M43 family zinc metalloprotease [Bacteroidia bacterium]